ncbi:MAG: glycosyltransferase [Croceibacterium sp.]
MTAAPGEVALLLYDLRGSGVTRNALRIAGAARDAGLPVSLWPMRLQGELVDSVPADIPIRPLRNKPSGRQRDVDSLASVPALRKALVQRRPDVLFSCGNHTHVHAALAMRGLDRRSAVRFVGRASNAVVSGGHHGLVVSALVKPWERFQYAGMDRIVAVSGELAGNLADLGLDPARIETIPNGIDLGATAAKAAEALDHPFFAPGQPPVVLGIGRLAKQKNFAGLLDAFAAARAKGPMRLLILGSGSKAQADALLQQAARLGVASDFMLQGYVGNPLPYLARAGLFVLSSRWEGASNVLLEALACGCPVVATRAPTGVIEVMQDGQIGPLVPVDDSAALAGAIVARLEQQRQSAKLIARAQDFALDRTLSAYARLLTEEFALARAL